MNNTVKIFDSTLRDGAQAAGISFSLEDKLNVVRSLDELGVSYIEAGNPGSNPKDMEFFNLVKKLDLKHARIAAFCSTRRKDSTPENDDSLKSALSSGAPVLVVVGKASAFQVENVLEVSLQENLSMIRETMSYLKSQGREVIFDAEHFFDGYRDNAEYALTAIKAAEEGGADTIVLCETNGGILPDEVSKIVREARKAVSIPLGIHCHNDAGCAVANSLAAVSAGATHVQGTYLGFGERCGNANLSTIIPNLQLKMGMRCIPDENIEKLTSTASDIADIANITIESGMPYVGASAFTHKGGMHASGVVKASSSFEHIDPATVGNFRRFLASEVAGKATILQKIHQFDPTVTKDDPSVAQTLSRLKELEYEGWQFESADASFELLVRRINGSYNPHFELIHCKAISEQPHKDDDGAFAAVKVRVDGRVEMTAAEGNGPVNAIDAALRKSLEVFYPTLSKVYLIDYKVRVLESGEATGAKVRVLITSTDGQRTWTTVGVSSDIIEASWLALRDSIEYKLLRDEQSA
ncbi:MAG: citramalate synthase [Clostridia bacterium]|nr:citramalate synthase [Clostridia bacterium]MBQ1435997.1 citramalate synthase [Clostridia bacterium]